LKPNRENDKDEEQMLDMLRSGQLQALITTASFANWVASTQCEFETVGDQFAMTDYGIGYASKLSPVLRQSLDRCGMVDVKCMAAGWLAAGVWVKRTAVVARGQRSSRLTTMTQSLSALRAGAAQRR
jgi:hypothetical protein